MMACLYFFTLINVAVLTFPKFIGKTACLVDYESPMKLNFSINLIPSILSIALAGFLLILLSGKF